MPETPLHQQLKDLYAGKENLKEHRIGGFRIDAVRNPRELVEIQTANFGALRPKLDRLLKTQNVRLVYPVCKTRYIVSIDHRTKKRGPSRRSPKHGQWIDLFQELVYLADLLPSPNLTLEVLLTEEEELRFRSSGRRVRHDRGDRVSGRRLLRILDRRSLRAGKDFLNFIPSTLASPFSTRGISISLEIDEWQARQVAYCLRAMKLLVAVGKIQNNIFYARAGNNISYKAEELRKVELRELRRSRWPAYKARIRHYYGPSADAILEMEDHLADLADLLRDTSPQRASTLLRRESGRVSPASP